MKTSASFIIGAALCAMAFSGCDMALRQDMADQPKNRPLSPSEFFSDGRSERPLIENTVPRGSLENDVYNVSKDYAGFPLPVNESCCSAARTATKYFARRATVCKEMATAWPRFVA